MSRHHLCTEVVAMDMILTQNLISIIHNMTTVTGRLSSNRITISMHTGLVTIQQVTG